MTNKHAAAKLFLYYFGITAIDFACENCYNSRIFDVMANKLLKSFLAINKNRAIQGQKYLTIEMYWRHYNILSDLIVDLI